MSTKNVFMTTAIDYVNALPHLGTAYEKIGADAMARFKRLQGENVFFLMGLDEHSVNVEKEASRRGVPVHDYCDEMSDRFQEVWGALNVSYDEFIRTSSPHHVSTVQHVFSAVHQKGDIYPGHYEGWYCTSCESYLRDKDLVEGLCSVHKSRPDWIREKNYFFALSRYADALKKLLETTPDFIQPRIRYNEILNVIEGGLEDISVSRAGARWGIPLPFDSGQIVYVWFDALLNYISAIGYPYDMDRFRKWWPAEVHVIGKDITRFHCVIWPAMLMSLDLPPPRQVFGHGFVYLKGEKMSKTAGTRVGPLEAAGRYGADALRYFLLREIPFDRDGDFSWEAFSARYEADLANDLGNLVQRTLSMVHRYCGGRAPHLEALQGADEALIAASLSVAAQVQTAMQKFEFSDALVRVWGLVQKSNGYIDQSAPWSLAKDPGQRARLDTVLHVAIQVLARLSILLDPVMPATAARIREQLGSSAASFPGGLSLQEWRLAAAGSSLGKLEPLFPKTRD